MSVGDDHSRGATTATSPHVEKTWNPRLALLLSLVVPGAGQFYKGQKPWQISVTWFAVVIIGYLGLATRREWSLAHDGELTSLPGLMYHFVCIADAYMTDPNLSPVANAALTEEEEEADRLAGLARAEDRGERIGRAAAESLHRVRRRFRRWN